MPFDRWEESWTTPMKPGRYRTVACRSSLYNRYREENRNDGGDGYEWTQTHITDMYLSYMYAIPDIYLRLRVG